MLSSTSSTEPRSMGFTISSSAIDPESLALLFLFSSSTARFGRAGQVAYAAANEYLNKWAQQQAVRLQNCRVVSFNWGPWAGGMVTDALKPIFEQEGISLIPLEQGAKLVVEQRASKRAVASSSWSWRSRGRATATRSLRNPPRPLPAPDR